LELPIDHFRLLGVGPDKDAQAVLQTLDQRLERKPSGYSEETIDARAELLRSSATLLSDQDRRAVYEAQLTALSGEGEDRVPALDLPPSKEVAGLLLLLEAGQPLECFQLARRALQPPQAPVLGSSREADLTRVAAEASLAASEEFQHSDKYESAALVLQEGLHLLQRVGHHVPEMRETFTRRLEALIPYRILDLIRRDLTAKNERKQGMELLEDLVRRRGGLEGDLDPNLTPDRFQSFFKQIRGFLTVQEQVDLFSRWGDAGSAAADFLAATALTASGFAQRKPERIAAARDRLLASGRTGVDTLLANLNLLLGDVQGAKDCFSRGASPELRQWAGRQSKDPLAQLCAYCRDWLAHDVLPGYRDLEADPEPDLEAYFSDHDVVAYVEREDDLMGRPVLNSAGTSSSPVNSGGWAGLGGWSGSLDPSHPETAAFGEFPATVGPPPSDGGGPSLPAPPGRRKARLNNSAEDNEGAGLINLLSLVRHPAVAWTAAALGGLALILLLGNWLFRARPPSPSDAQGTSTSPPTAPQQPATEQKPAPPGTPTAAAAPLSAASPSQDQIRALLQRWLQIKADVLGGGAMPSGTDRLAREGPIERLEGERQEDRSRGERQKIEATITDLAIIERSKGRIAARAAISYTDQRLDSDGKEVERTPTSTLTNIYVFGRDDGVWRLAAYYPAD
jgi:hypothetical protein